jgi:hypothetical protein
MICSGSLQSPTGQRVPILRTRRRSTFQNESSKLGAASTEQAFVCLGPVFGLRCRLAARSSSECGSPFQRSVAVDYGESFPTQHRWQRKSSPSGPADTFLVQLVFAVSLRLFLPKNGVNLPLPWAPHDLKERGDSTTS